MEPNLKLCPLRVVESLRAYIEYGVPLGDFLQAVVEDRLLESYRRADEENLEALPHICAWIYWNMPTNLRGPISYRTHLQQMASLKREKSL